MASIYWLNCATAVSPFHSGRTRGTAVTWIRGMVYISRQNMYEYIEGREDVLDTERLITYADRRQRLTKDDVFSMLSNRRRRLVLHHLHRQSGAASVRGLSKQVAAWENGVSLDELTYKQRKRVYTSLHQTHLPKLDDIGVVVYDRDRGSVELTDKAIELEPYLHIQSEPTETWSVYYLALAGLSALVVSFAWIGLFPFPMLPDIVYAALITVIFAVSATVHTYQIRSATVDPDTAPPDSARPSPNRLDETVTDGGGVAEQGSTSSRTPPDDIDE